MKRFDDGKIAFTAAGIALVAGLGLQFAALVAQTSISADGVVESTSGGLKFPDGTVQVTAAAARPAPVEATGQQLCWDSSGNGVACSGTGQDGELQRGAAWPTPRFVDNGDGTVTDMLTGLIWLQQTNCFGEEVWLDALSDANALASGACSLTDGSMATDWRLPSISELNSLLDYSQDPAVDGPPFLDFMVNRDYWSSTSSTFAPENAYSLCFGCATSGAFDKDVVRHVWPVRGGR